MKYILAVGLGVWWFGMATPSLAIDAAKLFAEKCAVCHGAKGEGTATGPEGRRIHHGGETR
jgi:mono/diheme cytochrome c family protein